MGFNVRNWILPYNMLKMYILQLGKTFGIFCEMHARLSAFYPHYFYYGSYIVVQDSLLSKQNSFFKIKKQFMNHHER